MKSLLKLGTLAVLALMLAFAPAKSEALVYHIDSHDRGGVIDAYAAKYKAIRAHGARVIIDAPCDSACTLVVGLVPAQRVCVTENAQLGFHSGAYRYSDGRSEYSRAATEQMRRVYPTKVRAMLRQHGWDGHSPHPEIIYLTRSEVLSLFKPCA